ncbi:MAG: FGGY-family carbohydrate kinase [Phycisphaerales bacterium]|nr:FGGY-family carbohydrate kinase [Phycisphaerales bacterium]
MRKDVAVGLDIGTGGARALAMDLSGAVVAGGRADLPPEAVFVDGPRVEQEPRAWTTAAQAALRELTDKLRNEYAIIALSIDATSGTFLLADENNQPLTRGLMYNDLRAAEEAPEAAEALHDVLGPYGITIAGSFALPKIMHLARTQAETFARCRRIVHQTDWIAGMLCGRYDITDISTALKTGADPGKLAWPAAISGRLGISSDLLPQIVLPGMVIGEVTAEAAKLTGLPKRTPVVSGCTDGTAGCLASGAKAAGDLNVTLGTTLVFKAVAERPLLDPAGAVYNHRHPAGGYLPGAASSTGGEWVTQYFANANLDELGDQADGLLPTGRLAYPLVKKGERFPFACPTAKGFGMEEIDDPVSRFAAGCEGTAFVERMSIEGFAGLGLSIGDTVYATGGGTAGRTWLRIRSAVNRRVYAVPEQPECAAGATVLAATPYFGDCGKAIAAMVRIGRRVEPEPALADAYDREYARFVDELGKRGYR